MTTLRQAGAVVVQPREPYFDDTIRYAVDNGFELELIHLANPSALAKFGVADLSELNRRLAPFHERLWLHGPFYDLYINSPDEEIRAVSEKRIEQSLRVAEDLGADHVIFHTNHLPCTTKKAYTERWREISVSFWSRMCRRFAGRILLENMWDDGPSLLQGVLAEVPELGACLDTGHANVFSRVPLADWIGVLGSRLRYVHLSDNNREADDALPPGEGTIDWVDFSLRIMERTPGAAVMVGMDDAGLPATRDAIRRMRRECIYPFLPANQVTVAADAAPSATRIA